MAGRRTNLALLAILAVVLTSGGLAYAIGSTWGRWVVIAHGVAGLALIALSPWKSMIMRRALRRERPGRGTAVALGVLLVATVLTGLLHATGLGVSLGPVSSMQVHVAAALATIPLAIAHVLARPARPRRADLSRRVILRAGALAGVSGLAWLGTEGVVRALSLPGADRRFTGSHETGSFDPVAMPVTQWLDDRVRSIDAGVWRLRLAGPGGATERSLDEIEALGLEVINAVLDCTGGWFAEQEWAGVPLDRVLSDALGDDALDDGRSISVRSATGYARRLPTADAPRLLIATRVGGEPLSAGHGAPARLVAPGRRGFWWVKWVVAIEVSSTPWWWQPPFPVT